MIPNSPELSSATPDDLGERLAVIESDPLPGDTIRENVEGHRITTVEDGFGQRWSKCYQVRLEGVDVSPEDVVEAWKKHYTEFWPKGNRLYHERDGVHEGDVAAVDLTMAVGTRLGTGIVVTDEQSTSFTFATIEGHTLCGTNTFSAFQDGGVTVAEVAVDMRASDPLFELGMPLGGHIHENRFWKSSLRSLGRYFGVEAEPTMEAVCTDRHRRWQNAGNIRDNAYIWTSINLVRRSMRRIRAAVQPGSSEQ